MKKIICKLFTLAILGLFFVHNSYASDTEKKLFPILPDSTTLLIRVDMPKCLNTQILKENKDKFQELSNKNISGEMLDSILNTHGYTRADLQYTFYAIDGNALLAQQQGVTLQEEPLFFEIIFTRIPLEKYVEIGHQITNFDVVPHEAIGKYPCAQIGEDFYIQYQPGILIGAKESHLRALCNGKITQGNASRDLTYPTPPKAIANFAWILPEMKARGYLYEKETDLKLVAEVTAKNSAHVSEIKTFLNREMAKIPDVLRDLLHVQMREKENKLLVNVTLKSDEVRDFLNRGKNSPGQNSSPSNHRGNNASENASSATGTSGNDGSSSSTPQTQQNGIMPSSTGSAQAEETATSNETSNFTSEKDSEKEHLYYDDIQNIDVNAIEDE